MLDREIKLLNSAYESYNEDSREDIDQKVIQYIRTRIIENKNDIENFIELEKLDDTFDSYINAFDIESNKISEYKKEKEMTKIDEFFVYGKYTTSVGNIVVETNNISNMIRYFVRAIKTRNTITISCFDYYDYDLKNAILMIFRGALSKFDIDPHLLMIVPYEECDNEKFDKVIYDEDQIIKEKTFMNKLYLYLENDGSFKQAVENEYDYLRRSNENVEIIRGDFYEVIKTINSHVSKGACIYTTNAQKAYRFLNLVHANNVFVNASLQRLEYPIENSIDSLYMKKRIMYPVG